MDIYITIGNIVLYARGFAIYSCSLFEFSNLPRWEELIAFSLLRLAIWNSWSFHHCYRFLHVFMRIVWTQSPCYERNSCDFIIVKTLWESPVAENQGVVMETINSQDLFFISASLFREYFLWMAPQCMLNCLHNFILFKCFYTMARCSTFTLCVSYFEQSVLEKASGLLIRLRKTWPQNHVKQFSRWSLLLTSVTAFDVPYLSARALRINLVSWHLVQPHCSWGGKHVLSSYPEISVLCSLEAVAKSTVFCYFLERRLCEYRLHLHREDGSCPSESNFLFNGGEVLVVNLAIKSLSHLATW